MRNQPRYSGTQLLAATLLAGCVAAATPARAADVTAEGAQQLEKQVHGWLATLLGARADLPDRPVRVTAEDEQYRVEIPLNGLSAHSGFSIEGAPVTALAKPLDGGRWALDRITLPSPLRVAMKMGNRTSTTTYTVDEQDQHAVLDPSLATASNWDSTVKGYSARSEGPDSNVSSRFETVSSHMTLQPSANGRVNALQEIEGSLVAMNAMAPKAGLVAVSAAKMHGSLHMDNMLLERIPPIIQAFISLAPTAMAAAEAAQAASKAPVAKPGKQADAGKAKPAVARPGPAKMSTADHAALHAALEALRDLTDGFGESGSLEDVHIDVGGHGAHLARLAGGMDVHAPDGLLAFKMNFGLDGLDSPDIPPGIMRDYLPRHIAFAPRFSGVPAKALLDLLIRAADSDGNAPGLEADGEALMNNGPVAVGLDELALDFGPATLKGHGELRIADRETYNGEAHLAATGIDDLIHQANANPELQQAGPVLILLKGLGKQDGETLVWDITFQDHKLLVNGNDMSQMMPGK